MSEYNIEEVGITTSGRLHFNSLKMNSDGGRGCGGIGLALSEPTLSLSFAEAELLEVKQKDGGTYFAEKVEAYARKVLSGRKEGARITIEKTFPSHLGLGSGTQLGLATGLGLSVLYGLDLNLSDIATLTCRAGVSGIGYYSFSHGGLIVDGGYPMGEGHHKKNFATHSERPPPLLARYDFPSVWKVLLISPPVKMYESFDENALFEKHSPVPMQEIGEICVSTLMGIMPAVADRIYPEFMNHLSKVVGLGTKRVELELNRETLFKAMETLKPVLARCWTRNGDCQYDLVSLTEDPYPKDKLPYLGVSSLGPLMYTFLLEDHHELDALEQKVRELVPKDWDVTLTEAKNQSTSLRVNDSEFALDSVGCKIGLSESQDLPKLLVQDIAKKLRS